MLKQDFKKTPLSFHDQRNSIGSRFKFLIPYMAPYKKQIFYALFSVISAVVTVFIFGWLIKTLIDEGISESGRFSFPMMMGGLIVISAALSLASAGRSYYMSWLGERILNDIRLKVFKHLLSLDVGFFELLRPGDLISRLNGDTQLVQVILSTSLAIGARNLLFMMGGLVMMGLTSFKLTVYVMILVPLMVAPILYYGKRIRYLSHKTQGRISDFMGLIGETLGAIRTTQAFMHEAYDAAKATEQSELIFQTTQKRLKLRAQLVWLVMMIAFCGVGLILWVGGNDIIQGVLQPGELSSFIFYAILAGSAAGSFSEIQSDLQKAAGAMERLQEWLETTPSHIQLKPFRRLPVPPQGTIAFHKVTFSYPDTPHRPILKNVTFSAAPGETIAIVGPSGAGKSTIFSLLLQFFTPQSGGIYIDGINVKDASVEDVRRRMGFVSQEPDIFSRSLFENILYGRPDASEEEVYHAAKAAHLEQVIAELPHGMKTIVGDRGIRLSGGQKQRVAIARAILRDPAILLLDEATSALDIESEHLIQASLNPLVATRTTIIIAHRLSTVLKADRIIVLHHGEVESVGNHAELINKDGLYRRLALMQFSDTQEAQSYRWKNDA